MSRNSCIVKLESDSFVMIRKSNLILCNGNECAAALINYYAFRHDSKLTELEQNIAIHRNYKVTKKDYLIQASNSFIAKGLLFQFSRNKIIEANQLLESLKIIEIITDIPTLGGGKPTNHILLNVNLINQRLKQDVEQRLKQDVATSQTGRYQHPKQDVATFEIGRIKEEEKDIFIKDELKDIPEIKISENDPDNQDDILPKNEKEKSVVIAPPEISKTPVEIVIDYLNQAAGHDYDPETKTTKRFIGARLKKYKIQDLLDVIDLKVAEWSNNEAMKVYLRPETLFNETKFEGYLQTVKLVKQGKLKINGNTNNTGNNKGNRLTDRVDEYIGSFAKERAIRDAEFEPQFEAFIKQHGIEV